MGVRYPACWLLLYAIDYGDYTINRGLHGGLKKGNIPCPFLRKSCLSFVHFLENQICHMSIFISHNRDNQLISRDDQLIYGVFFHRIEMINSFLVKNHPICGVIFPFISQNKDDQLISRDDQLICGVFFPFISQNRDDQLISREKSTDLWSIFPFYITE